MQSGLHTVATLLLFGTVQSVLRHRPVERQSTDLGWGSSLSFLEFENKWKAVFDHSNNSGKASCLQLCLRKGYHSVEFWTVADASWNEAAHHGVFYKGLNKQLKDKLNVKDESNNLSLFHISPSAWTAAYVRDGRDEQPCTLHRYRVPPDITRT